MKSKKDNNGIGILIAEDSRTQAEQLGFLLEQNGYQVTIAADGKLALAAAQAQKPALVISDIVMPVMDGYELCKAIKADEKLKDIPVILVTTLSDAQDVIRGLECGADNFIRKPYDERYLLSRIGYLLMNLELRKNQKMQTGVEIDLGGHKHFITAERQQILDLLISTYEQAVHINDELKLRETELEHSNQVLNGLYNIAVGLNQAITEHEVAQAALERALELPGIQAGWISLWEEESGFRLVATRNLPPALLSEGVMDGLCDCQRRFLAGELDRVTNIMECERLKGATDDTHGLRYHASVPLWTGDRTMGIMNLVGAEQGLFDEAELKMLYGVGNQVAVALERARLHEHLEHLVEERTAALRNSEDKLTRAQAVAQVGSWNFDIASNRLESSAEAHRIFGIPGQEVTDMETFVSTLHPDDREMVLKAWGEAVAGATYDIEHRIVASGETRWVRERAIIERDAEGRALYGIGTTQDITQRKQAEDALRDSRESLSRLLNSMAEGAYGVDTNGICTFVNLAFLQMLGYPNGNEVLGKHIHELIHHSLPDGSPYSASECKMYRAYQTNQPINVSDEVFWRKDGVAIPVEYWSYPIVTDGGVTGAIATFIDITQRKENEAKIKRLNRIYAVLSGINTTIVRVREEGELFREACRIAVEQGRFTFVWIGKFDADSQQVAPVAQAGRDDAYLAQINLTARDDAPGSCALTTQALTEAKPVICNDIASDERMAVWRSEALSRGYRSVVALPLILEGKPVGVFVLYAAETGVFDEEEMRLLIEIAGDISFAMDNLKKEERLNYLAYYDVITGLPNRTLFYDRLGQHLHDVQDGEMVAVLAIDLERFRVINETFGRHAGDALLKQVAERLITMGVGVDHLARISADCFAMVLSNIREEADVVRFLENQVATALSKPFTLEGQELRISVRAGIAIFPNDGKDADTLFRNAEAAVNKTKLSGDKYLFYTPELNARVAEKLTLENKLRRALEREQLVLHYQPKVDLKSNQISGLEALMRWDDPDDGLVPPSKFIPLLEETGMIIEAGAWALAQAMADYRAWQAKGLAPPRVAVNVSQVQLQRKDFVSTIERVVKHLAGWGGGLEIEITESLIMQDIEANIQKLHAIREMGVEVAIDDFGTGYSSLSYIAKLPINALKIDRAFIINMTSNADDRSIVSAIISLAHTLNFRVVAEGVETHEQAKLLRLLSCDEIQGFLFSPGVPAEQIEEFLRNKKTLA